MAFSKKKCNVTHPERQLHSNDINLNPWKSFFTSSSIFSLYPIYFPFKYSPFSAIPLCVVFKRRFLSFISVKIKERKIWTCCNKKLYLLACVGGKIFWYFFLSQAPAFKLLFFLSSCRFALYSIHKMIIFNFDLPELFSSFCIVLFFLTFIEKNCAELNNFQL